MLVSHSSVPLFQYAYNIETYAMRPERETSYKETSNVSNIKQYYFRNLSADIVLLQIPKKVIITIH